MFTLAIHGYYFLLTKMKLIKHLLNFVEEFKMKKVMQLTMLEVIDVENLIIKILNYIVIKMVLDTIFRTSYSLTKWCSRT
jgi:hypothetical protein